MNSTRRPERSTSIRCEADRNDPSTAYARRVLQAVLIVSAVLLCLALGWLLADFLLLTFAGILLAVFLDGIAHWVHERTHVPAGFALAVAILALLGLAGLGGWLLAPKIGAQVDDLVQRLPQALERLRDALREIPWSERLLSLVRNPSNDFPGRRRLLGTIPGLFSNTFGVLAHAVIVTFLGLYLAVDPTRYRNGFLSLVLISRRPRAALLLAEITQTLRWWLLGRLASMSIVGVLATLGLSLLGIPLALTLGILAALLTFIPNLGPALSALPAVLLALLDGFLPAVYVVALYVGIQTVESYLITPLIEQRAVSLPPALILSAQVALGVVFGALGLILATPLTVAALVLVRRIYVEEILGDDGHRRDGEEP